MISFLTRFVWKKHGLFVGGLFLSVYFSYHLLQGPRSILYFQDLEARNVVLTESASHLTEERLKQEHRVAMLRPETMNVDLLEERMRVMLGYVGPDEVIIQE
jgi:cell division protein FtsB